MEDNKTEKALPCTIAPELHDTWKRLRRKGDPETIAKEIGVSRPVVDKALIYGNVTMAGVVDKINDFFENRIKKEQETAQRLSSLSGTTEGSTVTNNS